MSAKKRIGLSSAKLEPHVGRSLPLQGTKQPKPKRESFQDFGTPWKPLEDVISPRMARERSSRSTAADPVPARKRGRPRRSENVSAIEASPRFDYKREAHGAKNCSLASPAGFIVGDPGADSCPVEKAAHLLRADSADLHSLKNAVSGATLDGRKVKEIVGMVKDDDGQLFTVIRFADRTLSLVANSVLNKAHPQLVIKFYEAHLKWE